MAAKNAKAVGYIDSEGNWAYTQYTSYLNNPMDLVFDSSDNMYVASRDNHSIVQFKNNEYVKSFANTHRANALTLDVTEENIFYGVGATGSSSNDWKFYKLNLATGNITVIAGSGTKPVADVYSNGSAGNTLTAVIGNITGLVCTSDGYVYVVNEDTFSHTNDCMPNEFISTEPCKIIDTLHIENIPSIHPIIFPHNVVINFLHCTN